MIEFSREKLGNGLTVIVHEDFSTPLVAVNILYDVGSRDEDPSSTGLAHLFEHLMFGGSVNIPDFDTQLQIAGGENNAFTNNDITNYYLTIPADNIETALWLESDRMASLDFSETILEVQKKVVIEEFKQRYLNQPYGDAMLKLRPLAYNTHPYRWPTIGMDEAHIESVTLDKVREFFYSHYCPNNAILTIAGNIHVNEAQRLVRKWFDDLPPGNKAVRKLPVEPAQNSPRTLTLEKNVPADVIYKVWHTGKRTDSDFYTLDLLTDLLAGGESGRLYEALVREKKLFSDINAYITGDIDPGLLMVTGRLMKGVGMEEAEESINDELSKYHASSMISRRDMEKVRNKFEATNIISSTGILYKAMSLSYFELIGDAGLINKEVENYMGITPEMVASTASEYLRDSNCSTLYYKSVKSK
ncbi:MAG: pitrilysin family protein [Bacteroidales bacterium]